MKIRMIGKSNGTMGNGQIHVRGKSGRKFTFSKRPGEGYVHEAQSPQEAEEIFQSQSMRYPYFFTPILEGEGSPKHSEQVGDLEEKTLEELKALCKKLGIKTVPQDKERSMTRMLEAFKLGAGE